MFRFFTVPFVALLILLGYEVWAIVIFTASALSDALDGAMARTRNMITEWGTTYDPLADKMLIGLTAFLILPKYLGPWLVFTIIFIEMVLLGLSYYFKNRVDIEIQPNWWGKSKMIVQSFGVGLVLLYVAVPAYFILLAATWLLYVGILLAIISLVAYISSSKKIEKGGVA